MKRREAKFVHASPRLTPDQIKAAPHVRETHARRASRIARRTPPIAALESVHRGKKSVK